jgi:hypothetical protein
VQSTKGVGTTFTICWPIRFALHQQPALAARV